MSTFIPIDRATFRRNPDAGRTEWAVPGLASVTFERSVGNTHSRFVSTGPINIKGAQVTGEAIEIERITIGRDGRRTLFSDTEPKPFKLVVGQDNFRIDRPVEHFYTHTPAPDWLYKYVPTDVQCKYCGARFLNTDTETDDVPDGDGGEITIHNICPRCREPDCVELEYETPGAVAKELGLA